MPLNFDITASIVLYKNQPDILLNAVNSFLNCRLKIKLYLIDNSPFDSLKEIVTDSRVEYLFMDGNLGFGKGHNVALKRSLRESKYHLVLNPDVYFDGNILGQMFDYLELNPEVGQLTPKILYPNGDIQFSGKLLPTPFDLIGRRFLGFMNFVKERSKRYELIDSGYDKIMNVPNHLGCFMLIRTAALKKAGLFDENIFMYTEDIDLTRRIHQHYKTLYYPYSQIYHRYERGSYKSVKLLSYHIKSAITYFNKWGWFLDKRRKAINKSLLDQYLPHT